MSEFEDAWGSDEEFWDFVGENKRMVGLAISEGQGLDILNAYVNFTGYSYLRQ
jgi:hypothetical protein